MQCAMMLAPSANRVYAGQTPRLAAAEVAICAPFAQQVSLTTLAGVDAVRFVVDDLDEGRRATLAGLSSFLACFAEENELLRPLECRSSEVLDDDLVTIPKYQGKTNEQFTRLLLNLTLAAVERPAGRRVVLDPLAGRGTTLSTAWLMGHHAAGVEADTKALEAYTAFLKTYLRRKRLKHRADTSPVRREGRSLGTRLDAQVQAGEDRLDLTVFTGDTRRSAELFGKKRFDAVVTDAPYGVVHGSKTDVRGTSGRRDRSAAGLLREAVPVWASQLKRGGALGVAWNTYGLSREDFVTIATDAGLEVRDTGPWRELSHRVDSSIQRDVLVAVRPAEPQ